MDVKGIAASFRRETRNEGIRPMSGEDFNSFVVSQKFAAPHHGVRRAVFCHVPKVSVGFFVRRFTEDPQEITGFWFIGLP